MFSYFVKKKYGHVIVAKPPYQSQYTSASIITQLNMLMDKVVTLIHWTKIFLKKNLKD